MEIEKKYKINYLPERWESFPKKEIEQVYISKKPTIRLRKLGDDYILTIKIKQKGSEREGVIVNREEEFFLTKEEYEGLLLKAEDFVVQKTRYYLPLEKGKTAELDVFHGRLLGLAFVEVEFLNLEEANLFQPPAWFGEDVSMDRRYRNTELAKLEGYQEELFA